ncbi:MAG: hypothetical protein IH587_12715, partial [Anaerolineae bacterium]|nr:hypothetical protein [Anaerolineae bacterium]
MRKISNFNQDWYFLPDKVEQDLPDSRFERVTLPHTNKLFPSYFVDNHDYQFVSTYRKRFTISEDISGKRIFIDFEGAMLMSTVYINGTLLGVHKGGYTPFSFEITEHVVAGENLLTVYVDATEDKGIPPYGNLVDYLTFGGLYRDVYLRIVEACHIANVFARPMDVLTSPSLECDIQLSQWDPRLKVEGILEDAQGRMLARQIQDVSAESVTLAFPELEQIALWSLESPTLYNLIVVLSVNGEPVDREVVRFGFRSTKFSDDGHFYLNGEPLKLFGLNRHQTYPYIGAAAPARLQQLDAEVLKYELGCNVIRTAHYAQSPHFLNRCDEIGLL